MFKRFESESGLLTWFVVLMFVGAGIFPSVDSVVSPLTRQLSRLFISCCFVADEWKPPLLVSCCSTCPPWTARHTPSFSWPTAVRSSGRTTTCTPAFRTTSCLWTGGLDLWTRSLATRWVVSTAHITAVWNISANGNASNAFSRHVSSFSTNLFILLSSVWWEGPLRQQVQQRSSRLPERTVTFKLEVQTSHRCSSNRQDWPTCKTSFGIKLRL